jgi:SAM-dependent methyltransferase
VVSSAYRCQPIFARRIMVDALTDAHDWDERYRTSELIWKAAPNQWVRQYTQDLSPGTALDLASGEGRNAIWLADRGWQVTAVDFSAVAMEKAKELASQHGNRTADRIEWAVEDVLSYAPTAEYDLVLVIYLQIAAEQRKTLLQHAAAGGTGDRRTTEASPRRGGRSGTQLRQRGAKGLRTRLGWVSVPVPATSASWAGCWPRRRPPVGRRNAAASPPGGSAGEQGDRHAPLAYGRRQVRPVRAIISSAEGGPQVPAG